MSPFQLIVNLSTIIALIITCLDIKEPYNQYVPYVAYFVIAATIVSIVYSLYTSAQHTYSRKRLIKKTIKRMINSTGKIVMFGGDLRWADDYIETISAITSHNQIVEIIFPAEKIHNADDAFYDRIKKLEQAGASIYYTAEEHNMRCTLIDVDPGQENRDLCVISSKRKRRDIRHPKRNKYNTIELHYKNEKDRLLCDSFYRNYYLISKIYEKYS